MVKKIWIWIVAALLLCGCGNQVTFETVSDDIWEPVSAQIQQIQIKLPEDAALSVLESPDTGKLYLCDGYTVTLQTMEAGDLSSTLRQTTGFSKEQLPLIKLTDKEVDRYESAWSSAGEGEEQVGRVAVLDDGHYHYVLTVMAGASQAGQYTQIWQEIFDSFSVTDTAA